MSSGMWFVVCIPKKEYQIPDDASSSKSIDPRESLDLPDTQPPTIKVSANGVPETDSKHEESQEKGELEKKNSVYSNIYFVEKKGPLEVMLRDVLPQLSIFDAVWASNVNDIFWQVSFPCESAQRCDHILRALSARGIGIIHQSTVAVLPCSVFYQERELSDEESEEDDEDDDENKEKNDSEETKLKSTKGKKSKGFKAMQKQFLKSITARLTVAQVVESVKADSELTFDFVMFVVLASLIAAFGLMENSSVVIVASMLISPLMGPILAGTFGAAIRDKRLVSMGVKAEVIGLIICLIIGFLVGLACCEEYGGSPFPTSEMFGRGQLRSLWVGVLIAVPSGAGVALSVLGGNAGCLVGVAISASLLPPAVNAGLLWGISFLKHVKSYWYEEVFVVIRDEDVGINEALILPKGYEFSFAPEMDVECAILGVLSLLLTIINIICIIISALVVLKIKEVAPGTNLNKTSRFWTHDIKIAREYNKTIQGQEAEELGKSFVKEWANLNGMNPNEVLRDSKTQYVTLQDMLQDVEDDDVYRSILTYVPRSRDVAKRMTMGVLGLTHGNRKESYVGDGHGSSFKRIFSRRRKTKPEISVGKVDGEEELGDVKLRRRLSEPSGQIRISGALRRSLSITPGTTPGSLWPTQNPLRKMSISCNTRFLVTPAHDYIPPLPPRIPEVKIYDEKL